MPKRFISTELFDKVWFQNLPLKMKILWIFFITHCCHAGIIELNFRPMQFKLGQKYTLDEIQHYFGNQIVQIDDDKWLVVKFFNHQYGDTINPNNRVQKTALIKLNKYGITEEKLGALMDRSWTVDAPKDKDKDTLDSNNNLDKNKSKYVEQQFNVWWDLYDKKVGKPASLLNWNKIDPAIYDTIFAHTRDYTRAIEKQFRKDPERYLKKESWTDEVITAESVADNAFANLERKYHNE